MPAEERNEKPRERIQANFKFHGIKGGDGARWQKDFYFHSAKKKEMLKKKNCGIDNGNLKLLKTNE